jgi:hypothetical protein
MKETNLQQKFTCPERREKLKLPVYQKELEKELLWHFQNPMN